MAPPTKAAVLVVDDQRFRETLRLFLRRHFHYSGRQIGLTSYVATTLVAIIGLLLVSLSFGFYSDLALTLALASLLIILICFAITHVREQLKLTSRLAFWREVTNLPNPRFGFEHTVGTVLEKLRAFYGADECLLVGVEPSAQHSLHRVVVGGATTLHTETLTDECARRLLVAPESHAFVFRRASTPFFGKRFVGYDVIAKKIVRRAAKGLDALLAVLDAEAIISAPAFNHNTATARLFLIFKRRRAFSGGDLEFLSELIGQILPLIENLRLVDTLASSARESERQRIALDIHDSVVQRYIAIDLGLNGVRRKIQAGRTDIGADLEKLSLMAQLEISGLRQYAQQMSGAVRPDSHFLTAVQRLTEEFAAATGIAVKLKGSQDISLNNKLAEEAFQMISEGLSNIRRHTKASEATIEMEACPKSFNLRIANNGRNGDGATCEFTPKSIRSRAESLGGAVEIGVSSHGRTVLHISIPI